MKTLASPKQVLVTRPEHQASELCRLLTQQNMIAVRQPTLVIKPIVDNQTIKQTLANLEKFQWLVFVSANAVTMLYYHLDDGRMPHTEHARFAAIGEATAQAMIKAGLPIHLRPDHGYSTEALLAMPELQFVQGQAILIVRGAGGREELATTLRTRGASVEYLEVYKRVIPDVDNSGLHLFLEHNQLDAITITSVEALNNLLVMLDKQYHQRLFDVPVIVISDRIGQIAAQNGFKQIIVAVETSDAAIVQAVTKCLTGE